MRNRSGHFIFLTSFSLIQIENHCNQSLFATAFFVTRSAKFSTSFKESKATNNVSSLWKQTYSTKLFDITEWRDQFFEVPAEVDQLLANQEGEESSLISEPVREICILPFPLDDVLLQGETKELCLYEERFHKLFEKSTKCHNAIVAMGLMAPPKGILQCMPLCEIENYQVMQGKTEFGTDFSILCTIRAVGRASLLYVDEQDEGTEFLTGWCSEICDDTNYGRNGKDPMQVLNVIVNKIDELNSSIQVIEEKIFVEEASTGSENSEKDGDMMSEATMRRRILEAELVSHFGSIKTQFFHDHIIINKNIILFFRRKKICYHLWRMS